MALGEDLLLCEEIASSVGKKFIDDAKAEIEASLNSLCVPRILLQHVPMDHIIHSLEDGGRCVIVDHTDAYPIPGDEPITRHSLALRPYHFEYTTSVAEYTTGGAEHTKQLVRALFYRDVIYDINRRFLEAAHLTAIDCSSQIATIMTPNDRLSVLRTALSDYNVVGGYIVPSVAYVPEDVWSSTGPITWCNIGHGVWYLMMRNYPAAQRSVLALAKNLIGYVAYSDIAVDAKIKFSRLIVSADMELGMTVLPGTIVKADLP